MSGGCRQGDGNLSIYQFYQPPLYWQQFEDLAVELLREVYRLPDAQAVGRPGDAGQRGEHSAGQD